MQLNKENDYILTDNLRNIEIVNVLMYMFESSLKPALFLYILCQVYKNIM